MKDVHARMLMVVLTLVLEAMRNSCGIYARRVDQLQGQFQLYSLVK